MSFSKVVVSSAALAGIVFCATTFPLAVLSSKSVVVHVDDEPAFMGRVEDLAPFYLGFATFLSVGVGAVSLATSGWRRSAKKLALAEGQIQKLQQHIQGQDALIESLKFSDARLQAVGLDQFLDGGVQLQDGFKPEPETNQLALPVVEASEDGNVDTTQSTVSDSGNDSAQLGELLGQLRQVMHQVEQLRSTQKQSAA